VRVKVKMPDYGTTSSEVTVLRWFVEAGQRIERGRPLMEIETDKSTMEVESVVTGVVRELLVEREQSVEAGQLIAIIEVELPADSVSVDASPTAATATDAPDEQSQTTSTPASPKIARAGSLFSRNRAQKSDGEESEGKAS
jgi:2-oxoglutarate dehydrogenase E2 component (dihydrolipoamide succinyltransferase)